MADSSPFSNVTHILLNNSELGKISKEQKAGNWNVWQTSLHNPSFAEYANSCGGLGLRVEEPRQLEEALRQAFSYDATAAEALYAHLAVFAAGGPLFLDVPENNPAASNLIRRYAMKEVFGCARMYLGPFPDMAQERIFGVTTFELG